MRKLAATSVVVLSVCLFASALVAQSVSSIPFRAILSPANEVPPVTGITASGTVTIWVHVVKDASGNIVSGSVDFNARYQFPASVTLVGMHIHKGSPTVAGPVVIDSGLSGTNTVVVDSSGKGTTSLQAQVTDSTGVGVLTDLLANPGNYYANIHTTDNPGGVIRGQLLPADSVVLLAQMLPGNEVPPTAYNASAIATVAAVVTRDSSGTPTSALVTFDANYSGFPDGTVFTGFHIHLGGAGANGPVVINTGIAGGTASVAVPTGGAGNLHYDVEADMTNPNAVPVLKNFFTAPGNDYINVHTTVNPGGAIRSQLRFADRTAFQVTMSPANEVPPVTGISASAPAQVMVFTLRDSATGDVTAGMVLFDINFRFPGAATFTGLHIHDGNSTVAGPVTISSGLSGTNNVATTSGTGNIFLLSTVNSAGGLRTLNSLMRNPENQYVNIHTTVNPGGVARAPLMPANTSAPAVSATGSVVGGRTSVAPGGLMLIAGANMAKVSGGLGGFAGDPLPAQLNGVGVTVGGLPAPVVSVSPSLLVVQVPADSYPVPGSLPVNVVAPNGAASGTATVAASSPDLFFMPDNSGYVVKNTDFSLVSSTNAAAAGDILLAFGTNFGQTLLPMATGRFAPALPLLFTSPATVTVGGVNATVFYSIAAPGYVGLNQLAFQVPAGVGTGPQQLVVKIGTALSNTVTIALK